MITGPILLLMILAFILFSIIGLFNEKIGNMMKLIVFYIRNLRANRKNLRKLPGTARKFFPVLRRRRGLFLKKISKNYHNRRREEETGDIIS